MAGELKQVQVDCPCCRARLAVDVRTAKVVRWSRPEKTDASGRPVVSEEDWRRANRRVSGRLDTAEDAFGSALDKERRRGRDLDDLFRRASGRALGRGAEQDPAEGGSAPDPSRERGESGADPGDVSDPPSQLDP